MNISRKQLQETVELYQWLLSHTDDRVFEQLRMAALNMGRLGIEPSLILAALRNLK